MSLDHDLGQGQYKEPLLTVKDFLDQTNKAISKDGATIGKQIKQLQDQGASTGPDQAYQAWIQVAQKAYLDKQAQVAKQLSAQYNSGTTGSVAYDKNGNLISGVTGNKVNYGDYNTYEPPTAYPTPPDQSYQYIPWTQPANTTFSAKINLTLKEMTQLQTIAASCVTARAILNKFIPFINVIVSLDKE